MTVIIEEGLTPSMEQWELWDRRYRSEGRVWRGTSRIPVPCSGRALDLGCGNGKTLSALADAGFEAYGVDFSPAAVEVCRRLLSGVASVEVADVTELPYPDGMFDYVTAVHVLENLDDGGLEAAAGEIRRVLAPGGHVFVRAFTPDDMRSDGRGDGIYYRFFEVDVILDVFRGFEVVSACRQDEPTRFGTVRSRVECLLRKPTEPD